MTRAETFLKQTTRREIFQRDESFGQHKKNEHAEKKYETSYLKLEEERGFSDEGDDDHQEETRTTTATRTRRRRRVRQRLMTK